jgi:post-segregation antitoxin (ccd killing protein)
MYSDPDFFTALRMNEEPVTALAGTLLDERFISRPPRTCPYQRSESPYTGIHRGAPLEYDHTSGHTADMPAMERVTVTLPADLVERIDQLERNRSRFIAEAVEHELTQRRRDALLQSVQNPHPETTGLVDVDLSAWVSDLPTDETLVDASAGTPVRWIEGQGWTKESA